MKGQSSATDKPLLFDPADIPFTPEYLKEPALKPLRSPVWTQNKAQLIMNYLRYFVYITHHGTYIDAFAGPQEEHESECWAAKLVLSSEPRWLRHFHLCDVKRSQVALLRKLKSEQPEEDSKGRKLNRDIGVYLGDINRKIDEILACGQITEKEATFCLLDQRTFECEWNTVEKIASFKKSGNKIELFYFLANSWFERALSGQKDLDKLARWWGRADWQKLSDMPREKRKDGLVLRMKRDLGYKSAKAWPIYERQDGGIVMYYMIHASDHPEGPTLMSRAYCNTVMPSEPAEQLQMQYPGELG
jgi:three-Cys-motif partner protein